MSTQPAITTDEPQKAVGGAVLLSLVLMALLLIVGVLSLRAPASGSGSALVLAVPAFLAGVLSFMSPCTLPILPAYFAFSFQANKQSIVLMTLAFFLGLATTMTVLGATATALSSIVFESLPELTFWGGVLVIALGVMSVFGKGFAGPQLQRRPAAGVIGSYFYGATFALGWTACIGPILGSLLTLLASQDVAIFQGAVLAFIYSMGLGLPLIIVATFFSRLGAGSPFWRFMRGRGFEVHVGGATLYLHTTSIISGLLLIVMGYLLATGQLALIAQQTQNWPLARWVSSLEGTVGRFFGLN